MAAASAGVARKLDVASIDVVSCHSVNADEGLVALSPNTEEIFLFRLEAGEYRLFQTLSKHKQRVTGLSWSPPQEGYSRLASCSEDRTAYVWELDEKTGVWDAVVVEPSAPKAVLCIEWAPNGARFAMGMASKATAICYYEGEPVDSWIAKKVGSAKASVTCVGWHPNSEFMATGSSDGRVMVYNVSEELMLPEARPPFGELQLFEETGSWVHSVMFSTSGRYLAFLTQDSMIGVKDLSQGPQAPVERIPWKGLPFLSGAFLTDGALVACGFDFVPVLVQKDGGKWQCRGSLDTKAQVSSPKGAGGGAFSEARQRFGSMSAAKAEAAASTSHSGVITQCHRLPSAQGANRADELPRFSTSGQDGQVLIWQVAVL